MSEPDSGTSIPQPSSQEARSSRPTPTGAALDLREPRPAWIVAALGGCVLAALFAVLFTYTAPKPPSHPDIRASASALAALPPPPRTVDAADSSLPLPSGSGRSSSVVASVAPEEQETEVEGMDRDSALSTLARLEPELRACREKSADDEPEFLGGYLRVRLTLRAEGTVSKVEVLEDGVQDKPVTDCMLKAAKKWRFQTGGKAATITTWWQL